MAAAGSIAGAVLAALCMLVCSAAIASNASTVSPLPESNYAVGPACGAPVGSHASCLALELRPRTAAARALKHPIGMRRRGLITSPTALAGAFGLTPEDLRDVYFPGEEPKAPAAEVSGIDQTQTIALVDAYNDYHAEADLKVYDQEFGLPTLGSPEAGGCKLSGQESGCFEQVNERGEAGNLPFPSSEAAEKSEEAECVSKSSKETTAERKAKLHACLELSEAEGWSVEISTDIEMARAVCQNCRILLVEAGSSAYNLLDEAEQSAVRLGATEVSNSWGGEEPIEVDSKSEIEAAQAPFNHPGTVITASSGDAGYLNWTEAEEAEAAAERKEQTSYFAGADYPASAPEVVAVGGTKLTLSSSNRANETVWNEDPNPEGGSSGAGGGGCSTYFTAPEWQQNVADWSSVGCGSKRAVADVAADADPYTGVAVYDSKTNCEYGGAGVIVPVHWCPIGGTSVASPIVASLFALAGGSNGVEYPAQTLYSHLQTTSLHSVTSGGNGKCDDDYLSSCRGSLESSSSLFRFDCGEEALICNAAEACGSRFYDGPTGVGTSNTIAAFKPGAQTAITAPECKSTGKTSGIEGKGSEGPSGQEQELVQQPQAPPASASPPARAPLGGSAGISQASPKTQVARLTMLALTSRAAVAIRHPVRLLRLSFAFALSASAKIQLTLSKQVRVGGHTRWRKLPDSLSFFAAKGRWTRRLTGRHQLAAGRYRLTLTVKGGGSRAILFTVG
jgi:Subtilase family